MPDDDGIPLRTYLEGLLTRASRPARRAELEAELALPEFPMALHYLWRIYHRLRNRKGSAGFGASPIEWTDIGAFATATRTQLLPWEIQTLERIDDAFVAALRAAQPSNDGE